MSEVRINETRYRTLIYAAIFFGLICVFGAYSVSGFGMDTRVHQALLLAIALCCFASLWFATRARKLQDRAGLERIGMVLVGLAGLALAEAVAWTFVSPLLDQPDRSAFRAHFAFLPLYYMGAVALLRARTALKLCWLFWGVVLTVTLLGLYYRTGLDLQRDGVQGLLIWVVVGNPLVILLLHALPHYEDALDRSVVELTDLRQRTELMGKLAESERRFNLAIEGLQVGAWDLWLTPEMRHWCAPRLYELIGYAPKEFGSGEEVIKGLLHPDDRERVWSDGLQQLARGDILDVDCRLNTKHLGYRWFNSRSKAERNSAGTVVRLTGAIEDIHDRRTAEEALHTAQIELTRMAYRDALTELHNRRYFDEHFKREWERARRSHLPLALLLVDLDHFKAYNDRYGHPAGDLCLVEIAHLLGRATSRATDILARLGGEEFGVVLPDTTAAGAEEVAQRIQELLHAAAIPNEGAPGKVLTLSIGVSSIESPDGPSAHEMYEQADRALYEIKRRGRNGVLRFWGKANLAAVPHTGTTE